MLACAKRTAGGPRATLARGWRCAISSGTAMAKVAEGGAQLSRELRLVLDALPEAVTITDAAGRLAFANAAALQWMGATTFEAALARDPSALLERFEITTEDGRPLQPAELPGRRLLRGEPAEPLLLRLTERDSGQVRWTLLKASALPVEQGAPLTLTVLEDVTETKEQELRERFLSQASEALNASLDLSETLQRVASLAVPDLADWCLVELLERGRIRQVAIAHTDRAQLARVRGLRRRHAPKLSDALGVGAVLRTGRAEFSASIPDELLTAAAATGSRARSRSSPPSAPAPTTSATLRSPRISPRALQARLRTHGSTARPRSSPRRCGAAWSPPPRPISRGGGRPRFTGRARTRSAATSSS